MVSIDVPVILLTWHKSYKHYFRINRVIEEKFDAIFKALGRRLRESICLIAFDNFTWYFSTGTGTGMRKRNKFNLHWYGYGLVLKTQVRVRDGYGSKLKYWYVDGTRYVMIFKVSTGTERVRDNLKNGIRVRNRTRPRTSGCGIYAKFNYAKFNSIHPYR